MAFGKDREILPHQDDVGSLAGDVGRAVHRNPDVRLVKGGRIVYPVSKISDHVSGLVEGRHDPLFLIWVDFDEQVGFPGTAEQCVVAHAADLFPREHAGTVDSDRRCEMLDDKSVVSRYRLDPHPSFDEACYYGLNVGLRRIREEQKNLQAKSGFVFPRHLGSCFGYGPGGNCERAHACFSPLPADRA